MSDDIDIDKEWEAWKTSGDPKKLRGLVNRLQPSIEGALSSYGLRGPVMTDRAKLVAAKAIKSFDPSKGAKLKTYVSSHIKSLKRDAPSIQEPFVPGQRYRREAADLHNAGLRFADSFGREPTDEELAELTSIPLRKVVRIRSTQRARVPLSVVEDSDNDDASPDVIGSTRTHYDDWVDAVYAGLGEVDRLILMHKTGYRNADILENDAIASRTGLTPETIAQRARRIQEQLDSFHVRRAP